MHRIPQPHVPGELIRGRCGLAYRRRGACATQPLLAQLPELVRAGPTALPSRWWAILLRHAWAHDRSVRQLALMSTLETTDGATLAALAYAPFDRVLGKTKRAPAAVDHASLTPSRRVPARRVGRVGPLLHELNDPGLYRSDGLAPVVPLAEAVVAFLRRLHGALLSAHAQVRASATLRGAQRAGRPSRAGGPFRGSPTISCAAGGPSEAQRQTEFVRRLIHDTAAHRYHVVLAHHVLRVLADLGQPVDRCVGPLEFQALAAVQTTDDCDRSIPRRQLIAWHLVHVLIALADPTTLRAEDIIEYGRGVWRERRGGGRHQRTNGMARRDRATCSHCSATASWHCTRATICSSRGVGVCGLTSWRGST